MLHDEFQWYKDNQEELLKKYNGSYVVIKDYNVIGAFASHIEAIEWGVENYEPGTFLIQLCTPGNSAYTRNFTSTRVSFV
ncbi:MAG: hypothetical protein V4543_01725 [Bacteroidota bacterium]